MSHGTKVDPITLDIIENALKNARFEMDGVVVRISLSPVIREQHDEFPMICNERGQMIVGQFGSYIPAVVEQFEGDINEGDIFVWNDPYACKGSISHNNDWCVMMPIFHEDVLVGFSSIFGHMVDVGGTVPGSMPANARTIWEEGLRIPPVRIYDKGVLNEGVLDIMLNNSRTPDMNRADLMALIAGCRTAATRVGELCDRFGRDTYMAACDMLLERTREAMTRADPQVHSRGAGQLHRLRRRRRPRQRPVQDDADDLARGRHRRVRLDRHRSDQAEGPINFHIHEGLCKLFFGVYMIMCVRPFDPVQRGLLRPVRDRPAGGQPAQSALPGGALEPAQHAHALLRLPDRRARPERARICRWPPATAPARTSSSRAPTRTTNTSS